LGDKYKARAEETTLAGYHRLAEIMYSLAESYYNEVERVQIREKEWQ